MRTEGKSESEEKENQVKTGTYISKALGRAQPYAVLAPAECRGDQMPSTPRYPLLVLLHGLNGHYMDWTACTRLARYAASYRLVIVFPEGGDGWYTNAAEGGPRWEDDLIQEFLPHVQATLPVLPPGKAWTIGGLSMGGYGAIKLALKHPELFSTAFGHSGAFEQPMTPEVHPIFGDPQTNSARRRDENPFALAERAMSRWPTERPRLFLDCGTEDALLPTNRRFHDHLAFIGYPHTYQESPGYHTWPYWDRAFRTVLPQIAPRMGMEPARTTCAERKPSSR